MVHAGSVGRVDKDESAYNALMNVTMACIMVVVVM